VTRAFLGLGGIYGRTVAGSQYRRLDLALCGRRSRQAQTARWPAKPGDP
jgi:hypothetical protein